MKRLVIQNETELLCLQDMLKNIPQLMELEGLKLSAISNTARKDILSKIERIIGK